MSTYLALHNQLTALFLERLHLEVPAPDVDLLKTGMVDSLTLVELLLLLEQEFQVDISVDEIEIDHFRSIARIAEFVATHNGKRQLYPSEA